MGVLDRSRRENTRARDAPQSPARVTPEDLNSGNIHAHVLSEAVQHPMTIYPIGGSVVAGVAAVALPIAALPVTVGVVVVCLAVSAGNFVWRYFIKGEEAASERVNMLREQRRQQVVDDFDSVISDLQHLGYTDAAKSGQELRDDYLKLLDYLGGNAQAQSNEGFRSLAEDTFKQGLATLTTSRDLFKAKEDALGDAGDIQAELKKKTAQLAKLPADSPQRKSLGIVVEGLQQRLDLSTNSEEELTEHLAHLQEIDAALKATYIQLATLGHGDASSLFATDGGAATRLKQAVTAAKTVQDKLSGKKSAEQVAQEDAYLAAARRAEDAARTTGSADRSGREVEK